MARLCPRCGRALDETGHDVLRYPTDHKDESLRGKVRKVETVMNRGRGRFPFARVRRYGCRVRLVATSPATGKTLVPSHPQRLKAAGGASYVPVDVLELRKDA